MLHCDVKQEEMKRLEDEITKVKADGGLDDADKVGKADAVVQVMLKTWT